MCHKKSQAAISKKARGRPRQFNREEALNKALEVFWRYGYEQATMTRICSSLQLTSPSIYCAFGPKADLFLEALNYYRHKYWHPVFAEFLANPDFEKALVNLFDRAVNILISPEIPCGCLTVIASLTLPAREKRLLNAVNAMRQETREVFHSAVTQAHNLGQLAENCNCNALANALVNFFEGLSIQAHHNPEPEFLRQCAHMGVNLVENQKS